MQIFAGNFKMNKTQEQTKEYFRSFVGFKTNCKVMIAVPYTSLGAAKFSPKWLNVGAQNVHYANSGAYTGEISTEMLKEFGVSFVIVGHSERRQYYNETDQTAALRAKAAIDSGLEVIFCIGENLKAHENGYMKRILRRQIINGLKFLDPQKLIVAYEPIWAIGTGKAANDNEILQAHKYIKFVLKKLFNKEIPVLYGGSVTEENVNRICKLEGVNGVLVGGASLSSNKMKEIILRGTKK